MKAPSDAAQGALFWAFLLAFYTAMTAGDPPRQWNAGDWIGMVFVLVIFLACWIGLRYIFEEVFDDDE